MSTFRPRGRRFTIYDMMEEKGAFASNPANADAQDLKTGEPLYAGPVEYPKMFYHPEGQLFVAIPAMPETTPFGPKMLNEQKRLVTRVVKGKEEELEALAEGWHSHPAQAHAARQALEAKAPPKGEYSLGDASTMAETIRRMQQQLWEMQQASAALRPVALSEAERKELEELRALRQPPPPFPLPGSTGDVSKIAKPLGISSVDLAPNDEEVEA